MTKVDQKIPFSWEEALLKTVRKVQDMQFLKIPSKLEIELQENYEILEMAIDRIENSRQLLTKRFKGGEENFLEIADLGRRIEMDSIRAHHASEKIQTAVMVIEETNGIKVR